MFTILCRGWDARAGPCATTCTRTRTNIFYATSVTPGTVCLTSAPTRTRVALGHAPRSHVSCWCAFARVECRYVSRESNGAEIYGTAAAVYVAQPTVVWNIALAIAPAFHRPTVQAEAAYSVVVSQSIVLNARLLGWTGAGAPPEIEMMEHVLIEGPSVRRHMRWLLLLLCASLCVPPTD